LREAPRVHRGLNVLRLAQHAVRVAVGDLQAQTAVGAAVLRADDDVLGDVDQTTGEVTRVGGTQSRVRQTLTGTVRGDEVLQHGQTLTERGLDGPRDRLVLGVRHQTAHTGNLTHLHHVASRTRVHHHEDRVGLGEVVVHRLGDLVGRLGPDLDELLRALVLGDQTALVLLLDLLVSGLPLGDDLPLRLGNHHVGDGDGDAGTGGPVEAGR